MQRETVSACCLVALVLLSAVAATAPAGAAETASPSAASAATADDARAFNQTAFLALDGADDGAVVAGGQTGLRDPDGVLVRLDEDRDPEWTTRIEGANATRVLDVVAAGDGVYALVSEQSTPRPGAPGASFDLLKTTPEGEPLWRESLNASGGPRAVSMAESDDGVAVVHATAEAETVRLAEYSAGGDTVWEQTYGVRASPSSLRATDDGYLVAGSVGFDDPWVLATGKSGQVRLNETYPGIEGGGAVDAVRTDDDGVFVVGRHRGGIGASGGAWSARMDEDGVTQWTRVHGVGTGASVRDTHAVEDGLVLVGQARTVGSEPETRLLGLDAEGGELFDETVEGLPRLTATALVDGSLTVGGIAEITAENLTGTVDAVDLPESGLTADADLAAEAGLTSNETVYRGQNVRVDPPGATGSTYDLVRLPGERDDFDPRAVRRVAVAFGEDDAVVESATLPRGEYALRNEDGDYVALEDGRVTGTADREEAAFTVTSQRFFGVEVNRTFVDPAAGESDVSLTFDSRRSNYSVHVSAERYAGDAVGADRLRAAFGDDPRFAGVETVGDTPVARFEVGERGRINASAAAFGPGMYDITVSGVDTREGGAVADGRVVVGTETERPVGFDVGNESLTLGPGETVRTDLTLANASAGVGAISLSANRSGEPAVRLDARPTIDAPRVSAGTSVSEGYTATTGTAVGGDTANGTVDAAILRVTAEAFGPNTVSPGTNNVTVRLEWVVDENGVPYTVPDGTTVTVEVTGDGTDSGDKGAGGSDGGDGGSGGAEGGTSGSGSGSG